MLGTAEAAIFDRLEVGECERSELLGMAQDDLSRAFSCAEARRPLEISQRTLQWLSLILGIYEATVSIFPKWSSALEWLHGPHRGRASAGRTPLQTMPSDLADLVYVRRYLSGWKFNGRP